MTVATIARLGWDAGRGALDDPTVRVLVCDLAHARSPARSRCTAGICALVSMVRTLSNEPR